MDGELNVDEAEDIIKQLKKKNDLHGDWKTYHIIGDALRQTSALSIDISQRVSEQLKSEPAIFAPSSTTTEKQSEPYKRKNYAFSIAASVAIILAGWLGLQTLDEPSPILVVDNTMPMIPVSSSSSAPMLVHSFSPAEFNDYLFVHGEFSPGTATRGSAVYLQTVTDHQDKYRR